tara:strand:+ start:66 stop:791 length:726 start_codon:yes stop_codon:yes gene_type:complete
MKLLQNTTFALFATAAYLMTPSLQARETLADYEPARVAAHKAYKQSIQNGDLAEWGVKKDFSTIADVEFNFNEIKTKIEGYLLVQGLDPEQEAWSVFNSYHDGETGELLYWEREERPGSDGECRMIRVEVGEAKAKALTEMESDVIKWAVKEIFKAGAGTYKYKPGSLKRKDTVEDMQTWSIDLIGIARPAIEQGTVEFDVEFGALHYSADNIRGTASRTPEQRVYDINRALRAAGVTTQF